jgi:hypothetical protein
VAAVDGPWFSVISAPPCDTITINFLKKLLNVIANYDRSWVECLGPSIGDRNWTLRSALSGTIDFVRPNEKICGNFPRFTDLVDHFDCERTSARENFGRTRARAEEFGKLALARPKSSMA